MFDAGEAFAHGCDVKNENMKNTTAPVGYDTKPEVIVQLPMDPSFWGDTVQHDEVYGIHKRLEALIVDHFGDLYDITFRAGSRSKVLADDRDVQECIYEWIQNNSYKVMAAA